MDKYEYNVKLEQIKKLIRKKDYATAARIADTIDWYKVKNNQTIVLIADVYEASGRYEQARENLKLAYDRSGLGRQIAYKLVKVCIKCGKIDEAEDFYDDFVSAAPRDISKYLLQYELAKAKGEPLEKQISGSDRRKIWMTDGHLNWQSSIIKPASVINVSSSVIRLCCGSAMANMWTRQWILR